MSSWWGIEVVEGERLRRLGVIYHKNKDFPNPMEEGNLMLRKMWQFM